MATRLKTVSYTGVITNVVNNTLTSTTSVSIYLPENGKVFKSAKLTLTGVDIVTATGGTVTTKTVALGFNGGTKTTITNSNTLTNSVENIALALSYDFTSHFVNNWSGTNMLCDVDVLINQTTGTTLGYTNISHILEITYEYDDTSPTLLKTVRLPLNTTPGALPGSAGSNIQTIPAISTHFPEANKTFRDIFIVLNFNEASGTNTTNLVLSMQVGSTTVTYTFTKGLATNRFARLAIRFNTYLLTPSMHDLPLEVDLYSTTTGFNHLQAYVVFTYEYDEANTTQVFNSLMLPMEINPPFGGTTNQDYQRATRDLWIEEANVVKKEIAFFPFWTQATNVTGLNMRIGTGSFVTYTDNISVTSGLACAMVRNDSAFNLVKGKNTFNFDVYTTGTTEHGWGASGFWIINYVSDKSSQGSGAHNHTVILNMFDQGTATFAAKWQTAAIALNIPEDDYFLNGLGTELLFMSTGMITPSGFTVQIERLAAEGGVQWEVGYKNPIHADNEVGIFLSYSQIRDIFKRFPGDLGSDRIDIEIARRSRVFSPAPDVVTGTGWASINILMTYHSITNQIQGEVNGMSGTVTIDLWRATGEKVKTLTRSGNGSFSFTWYDDTSDVFVIAKDATNSYKSKTQSPNQSFILGPTGNSGPTYYSN